MIITLNLLRFAARYSKALASLFFCALAVGQQTFAAPGINTDCQGEIASATWKLWDSFGKEYALDNLIKRRLVQEGDTYALYDLEFTFHNLVSMADRCRNTTRLLEFSRNWRLAYEALELISPNRKSQDSPTSTPSTSSSVYRAWICHGGIVCNPKNRLLNTEVALNSAQALGLFSHLANSLLRQDPNDAEAKQFAEQTLDISRSHLNRWASENQLQQWKAAAKVRASDIQDDGSRWFFTDQALWQIGIYAELSGIMRSIDSAFELPSDATDKRAFITLLQFFNSRVSRFAIESSLLGKVQAADLDRGYWRRFPDSRYAGYIESKKPLDCGEQGIRSLQSKIQISPDKVPVVADIGWDISHARRLVHVLDALDRNRESIKKYYQIDESSLPSKDLAKEFAAQLLSKAWNGDTEHPLFSNWLSGANGWYRVGYHNGTSQCTEGYPPWGLSDAFPTGGYATWGKYYPKIRELAENIYQSSRSNSQTAQDFIKTHYRVLSSNTNPTSETRFLNQIMFWPTLIQIESK